MVNSLERDTAVPPRRRGRPRGPSAARDLLIESARQRFAATGYAKTTVRSIAEDAGVDHALVNYYFGSKGGLLAAVLDVSVNPATIVNSLLERGDQIPAEGLLRAALAVWDNDVQRAQLNRVFSTLAQQGPDSPGMREFMHLEVVERIAGTLRGPRASQRAGTVAAVMSGLFFTRYIARIEPLASMPAPDVVAVYTPVLRAALAPAPLR